MRKATCFVIIMLALMPLQGSAQSQTRFEITPHVGYFAPQDRLGAIARVGDSDVVLLDRADPGVLFITTASVAWPGKYLQTRITALFTPSLDVGGQFACLSELPCLALFRGTRADVRIAAAVVDALLGSQEPGFIRPYVLLGAGLKRYAFSWSATDPSLGGAGHVDYALAVHAGLGARLDVLGASIRAELSDYWSPSGGRIEPAEGFAAESIPGRRPQHDLALTVGYRLFRF